MKKPVKRDFVTRTIEAPAELLERGIEVTEQVEWRLNDGPAIKRAKDYWRVLGPGLTTGASDDDPSGIATYSQAGASYHFQLLWLAAFTFPLMALVQEMCARIGLVTGRGLAGNIRMKFSRYVMYVCAILLFAANTFNIGADIGAMAQGVRLVLPAWNFFVLVIGLTILMLALQIFTPYERYAKYLKWLAMVLFAYILSAFAARLHWLPILHQAVIPSIHFNKQELVVVCAVLGTTISPYLFFWQTAQEVEEQIAHGKTTIALRRGSSAAEIGDMRKDVWTGMLLSNVVMFFIIATCGALLFEHGITNIQTSDQAAQALRPFAGNAAYLLFALGVVGTGLLSIPVLAGSSSYAIVESLHRQGSLGKKLKQAYAFYGVIIISMLVGLGLNFLGINPIKALIWSAVLNGLVAPIILVLIILIASNRKIMGEWVNKPAATIIGWATVVLMAAAGVGTIISLFYS